MSRVKDARGRTSAPIGAAGATGVALRISPWPNDDLATVAVQLAPVPGAPLPDAATLHAVARDLANGGYAQAITVALTPAEQEPFLRAGFLLHEHLHLLTHDLATVPPRDDAETAPPAPRRLARHQCD